MRPISLLIRLSLFAIGLAAGLLVYKSDAKPTPVVIIFVDSSKAAVSQPVFSQASLKQQECVAPAQPRANSARAASSGQF